MQIENDLQLIIQRKLLIDKEVKSFYTMKLLKEDLYNDTQYIESFLTNQFNNRENRLKQLLNQYEQIINDVENSAIYSPELDDPDDPYNDRLQLSQRVSVVIDDIQATISNLKNIVEQKDKPFFGNLKYEELGKQFQYYIGKNAIFDENKLRHYVIDWRSPIANLFYKSTGSNEKHKVEINGKKRNIEVKLKQFVDISLGKLIDVYTPTSGNKEADRYLLSKVETKRAGYLQDIVNTIQSLQNEIIRSPKDKLTVIQGVAGSGKTTILFHKLAYLFFNYPKQFKLNNCVVVVPNKLFKEYTKDILISLGINEIKLMTFYEIIQRFLNLKFRYIVLPEDSNSKKILKKDFDQILKNIFKKYERELVSRIIKLPKKYLELYFADYFKLKIPFSKEKILEAYENLDIKLDINDISDFRIETIFDYAISKEKEWLNILTKEEYNYFKNSDLLKKYNTINIPVDYNLEDEIDADHLDFKKPKQKDRYINIKWEELIILFKIKQLFESTKGYEFDLIAVDEAQNYSIDKLKVFWELSKNKNLVIAGDMAQQLDNGIDNWKSINSIDEDYVYFEMNTSYRISKEIATFLSNIGSSKFKPKSVISRKNSLNIIKEMDINGLIKILDQQINIDDDLHIALITKNIKVTEKLYKLFNQNKKIQPYLVNNTFESGILISDVASVKGVEFDTVFLVNSKSFNENERYLASTRTLNRLIILEKFSV